MPIKGGHSQKSHYYTTDQLPNSNVMFIREKTESCLSVQRHTLKGTKTFQVIYEIINAKLSSCTLTTLGSKTDFFMHDIKEVESDATHNNFTSILFSENFLQIFSQVDSSSLRDIVDDLAFFGTLQVGKQQVDHKVIWILSRLGKTEYYLQQGNIQKENRKGEINE